MKTLLRSIIVIILASCISSCYNPATDRLSCKAQIIDEFPKAINIISPSNQKYRWIVVDSDSTIWYVETMSAFNSRITEKEKLELFEN